MYVGNGSNDSLDSILLTEYSSHANFILCRYAICVFLQLPSSCSLIAILFEKIEFFSHLTSHFIEHLTIRYGQHFSALILHLMI